LPFKGLLKAGLLKAFKRLFESVLPVFTGLLQAFKRPLKNFRRSFEGLL
jgi:hypothetical protein